MSFIHRRFPMNKYTGIAVAAIALTTLGVAAVAEMPGPPPTPSSSLGIEVDVQPVRDKPGTYRVSSVVTDLESRAVIAKPSLLVAGSVPATIQTGNEGKWMLKITVGADASNKTATYEANFTRDGKLVSLQKVSVALGT
jgi:hypothetical protein